MNYSFPNSLRLVSKKEFNSIKKTGAEYVGSLMIVVFCISTKTKLGITASRHYGKSFERNRFKRLIREAFRLSYRDFRKKIIIHVKPRTRAKKAKMQDIQQELFYLVGQFLSS